MKRTSLYSVFTPILAGVLLTAWVPPAQAATISGQVVDGTTGRPVANQKVQLLMPRGGMQQVAETSADAEGSFSLSGAGIDTSGFYLLQATYSGVDYHAPVQFDPSGSATINITTYDSSSSMAALRIPSARILVRAEGAKARVQELFGIRNPSQPPRTYLSPSGTFRFHIPPSAGEPTVAVAGLMNMPLPQSPRQGKAPGDFSIDYALKPGLTVVMVAYDADYSAGPLSLDTSVNYPIDQAELFVFPPSLQVDTPIFKQEGQDAETGSQKYLAENLAAESAVTARLSGEAVAVDSGSESARSEPQIKIVRSSVTNVGVPLLLCFLLVLLWALGIRIAKEWPRWKGDQRGSPVQKQFQAKYESVLGSIADLDELFASGKIPEKQYWKERLELKAKAVAILKKGPAPKVESYAARNTPR